MKKKLKAMNKIAISGLGLSALSSANTALGGTNLVGNLTQGYGAMLPAMGSMLGAGMVIDTAKLLKRKRR